MKFLATEAPTFLGYSISFLAMAMNVCQKTKLDTNSFSAKKKGRVSITSHFVLSYIAHRIQQPIPKLRMMAVLTN